MMKFDSLRGHLIADLLTRVGKRICAEPQSILNLPAVMKLGTNWVQEVVVNPGERFYVGAASVQKDEIFLALFPHARGTYVHLDASPVEYFNWTLYDHRSPGDRVAYSGPFEQMVLTILSEESTTPGVSWSKLIDRAVSQTIARQAKESGMAKHEEYGTW